jgi:outer membrane immunogenic protein
LQLRVASRLAKVRRDNQGISLVKKLLLGLSFSLLASTAIAADAVVEEVVVAAPSVFIWTGGYVGLQGGYAWGDGRLAETVGNDSLDFEPDGFIGGAYAGYNYQMTNNFVIGGEVDVVYADVDDANDDTLLFPEFQELNWSAAARLRVGYAVDRFLPYIAGGVAVGDIEAAYSGNNINDTFVGWTIGGGFDYAFTDNLVFRAEYRFTDFGSESFEDEGLELDLQTNEVRLGVAYKF